ncbi:hypothetical protein [Alcanivorax sp.]|uniref:hypothetical protein n=1 Tax=Alcanivorax sp. TaxID=1872427 RepID=UPI0025BB3DDA|nr:hypothetical protein [Alcanivorax sp.]
MKSTRKPLSMTALFLAVSALLVLSACGGGGSSSGAVNNDNDTSSTPDGLREVKAARFNHEDDVVLLAPGSLLDTALLSGVRSVANLSLAFGIDATGSDRIAKSRTCGEGGDLEVLSRDSQQVESPFSGANFDVIVTRENSCRESTLESGGDESLANGVRKIGYPISGDGSDNFLEETDFIGYEQSGLGLDKPYVVSGLFGSNVTQHRWWQGHTHLWRDDPDNDSYGDAGGVAEQYSIVYYDGNDGEGKYSSLIQFGANAESMFDIGYAPNGDNSVDESYIEHYQGVYGLEILKFNGNTPSANCPQGRFHVKTGGVGLYVNLIEGEEEDDTLYGEGIELNGNLEMEDEIGNTAIVTYDETAKTVTVELNENSAKVYTYAEIESLKAQRCFL